MTALHCCFCRLKHFFGRHCIQTADGVQLFAFVGVFLSSFKDLCSYCERQHTFTNVYIWYALIALKVHPLPHPVATFQVRQVSQATVLSQEAYLLFYVLDPDYKRVSSLQIGGHLQIHDHGYTVQLHTVWTCTYIVNTVNKFYINSNSHVILCTYINHYQGSNVFQSKTPVWT